MLENSETVAANTESRVRQELKAVVEAGVEAVESRDARTHVQE